MRIEILDDGGSVTNLITASVDFAEQWYPGRWREYVPPEPVPENIRILTRLAFRNRFTGPEKVAIYEAAKQKVAVQVFLDDVMAAEEINLDDPETVAGVQALEYAGLIGVGRADKILGAPFG